MGDINVSLSQVLLTYRMMPQTTTGVSPAELLQRRRLKTRLDLVQPQMGGGEAESYVGVILEQRREFLV